MSSCNLLSTVQLKDRGWTPTMIRNLLGAPDQERSPRDPLPFPNEPLQFYLAARVIAAEAQESVAEALARRQYHQARQRQAVHTRQGRQTEQVARHAAVPLPTLMLPLATETWTLERLWTHHLREYDQWCQVNDHLLSGLPRTLKQQATRHAFERYHLAFQVMYGARHVQS